MFRLIIVFLLLMMSSHLLAASNAIVRRDRAVVYADLAKTAPIGFIRLGKKIRVGTNEMGKYKLLPIVVSGKVAYIQAKDVNFVNDNPFEQRDKREAPKSKMHAISGVFFKQGNWSRPEAEADPLFGSQLGFVGLELSSALLFKKWWLWQINLDAMYLSKNDSEKKYFSLSTGPGINFLKFKNIWLNGYLLAGAIPYIQAKGNNLYAKGSGFFYGPKGELIIEMTRKFNLGVNLGFYKTSISNFEGSTEIDQGYSAKFTNISLGVGVVWITDII